MNDTAITAQQFERIASLARDKWGLSLSQQKLPLVTNRLTSFLRQSPFKTVAEYLRHLEEDADQEDMLVFFDILSTNVTSFFRDRQHFDYLEREFFTPLARGNLTLPGRAIRIWSAGCSTGCEPYSMAIWALEHLDLSTWDVQILATDLSNYAIEQAKAAVYERGMLKDVPPELASKYFTPVRRGEPDQVTPVPRVREMVKIARLNLMDPWPMRGPFDIIFCRNVMIYFDAPTRAHLVGRYRELLRPGGILAVGSSETLSGLDVPFRTAAPSLYLK